MISIRKFVGYAGAAAGLSAALTIAMSTQTGVASTQQLRPAAQRVPAQVTLSAGCTAALQNLKAAFISDLTEDRAEYEFAKLNGGGAENDTDSTEAAGFVALWTAARTACAPSAASSATGSSGTVTESSESREEGGITTHQLAPPSTACVAAIQAVKAGWLQRPSTPAQWLQLRALAQAARAACGASFTG